MNFTYEDFVGFLDDPIDPSVYDHPHSDESYTDYMVRLFENKQKYHLNCTQIAELLNRVNGNNCGECTYRKFYKAFNEGRKYEQGKNSNGRRTSILSISDLHIPFQKPVEAFAEYAGKVGILQINGDVVDCSAISKFPKVGRSSIMDDIIVARDYLIDLIRLIDPARVVCNYGNHDIRFESFLTKTLQNDLAELMPRTPLELIFYDGFSHYDKNSRTKTLYAPLNELFDNTLIMYEDNWYSKIGKTIFCHPISYKGGIMKTSEAAVRYFESEGFDFDTLVMAHTHHIGNYMIGNVLMFEQGAACNTKEFHYADGRLTTRQNEGCLYLELDESGARVDYQQKIFK